MQTDMVFTKNELTYSGGLVFNKYICSCSGHTSLFLGNIMFRYLIALVIIFANFGCSSSEPEESTPPHERLLTFDVYNQDLETMFEVISSKYGFDLDFDVEDTGKKWSLSVYNGNINDTLNKISSVTGVYTKYIDEEILVQEELFEDDLKEITLQMNSKLWTDIRSVSKIDIDEEAVAHYFGPLFTDSIVTDVDSSERTITLKVLPQNEQFIRESLSLLNYTKQRRNLGISLIIVETNDKSLLKSNNIPQDKIKFSWGLNAGDNLNFSLKTGEKIQISSKALFESNAGLNDKQFELKLSYKDLTASKKYDNSLNKRDIIELDNKTFLLVNAHWYINNKRVNSTSVTSDMIKSKNSMKSPSSPKISVSGNYTLLEWADKLSTKEMPVTFVLMTEAEDSKKYQGNFSNIPLPDALSKLSNGEFEYEIKDGKCILFEERFSPSRKVYWTLIPETMKGEAFFKHGAFVTEVNNEKIQLLPAARAWLTSYGTSLKKYLQKESSK